MTATMTSSKCTAVRSMMSRWPFVTGSNEPGISAIATCSLSLVGGQRHHGTAVAARSHDSPARADPHFAVGLGHEDARAQPAEEVVPRVELVGRVDQGQVERRCSF